MNETKTAEFYNSQFLRGRPDLLCHITRDAHFSSDKGQASTKGSPKAKRLKARSRGEDASLAQRLHEANTTNIELQREISALRAVFAEFESVRLFQAACVNSKSGGKKTEPDSESSADQSADGSDKDVFY